MTHPLTFSHLVEYDAGQPGIALEVKISRNGHSILVPTKVDTGATHCIFARRFGEQLGLDIETGDPLSIATAAGSFPAFRHEVTLSLFAYDFDAAICFAANESFTRNVLGRKSFLDRVLLGLNDYEGKLYLSSLAELWQ